jgi:hypothetical protein
MQVDYRGVTGEKDRGMVMILAMVFLLLLTLVATTVMEMSAQEFQMAGNNQFREEAFQRAQAIAEELADDPNNFPVVGTVGYTVCTTTDTDVDCNNENFLQVPGSATAPEGVAVAYQVVRQGPKFVESLPFRESQANASSSLVYDAAIFEVAVAVDGSEARLGSAEMVQGVAVRVVGSVQ